MQAGGPAAAAQGCPGDVAAELPERFPRCGAVVEGGDQGRLELRLAAGACDTGAGLDGERSGGGVGGDRAWGEVRAADVQPRREVGELDQPRLPGGEGPAAE